MNATESQIRAELIVRGLYARGVDLFAEGGEIHYRSSLAAIVTDDDRVDLDENKVGLIAFLLIHKQGRLDNVIPFPAPRDGREKKSPTKGVLDYWNAAMADFEAPGDEAG